MDEERIAELDRLAESDPAGRTAAFSRAVEAAGDAAHEIRIAAARAVGATGEPTHALRVLEQLASDDNVGVRYEATSVAAGLPWRGRRELLARRLEDPDLGIAAVAADGLAFAGDRRAVETLRELVGERRLRFTALEALLQLDDEWLRDEAPAMFRRIFGSPFEKALAAVVLSRHGDEAARAHLRGRITKRRAEERPFIVVHLAAVDPGEGRAMVESIARAEDDYLRESALLALVKLDRGHWSSAQAEVGRHADSDPHVAAEVLLGLFEIEPGRAALIANAHVHRQDELGSAARRVRLTSALREAFPNEVG